MKKHKLATVNFVEAQVTIAVPLEVLRDKIRQGLYIPQADTVKREII